MVENFPRFLYAKVENEGTDDEYFTASAAIPDSPDDHGKRVGEYRLVRTGKINILDPQVKWKK